MKAIQNLPQGVDIKSFFAQYRNIYIYGAGKFGGAFAALLEENNIKFNGYLVTQKTTNCINGYPVYEYGEIYFELDTDDCIVLAVKIEYQIEVLKHIGDSCSGQLIDIMGNSLFNSQKNKQFIESMESLACEYPPQKYHTNNFNNILVIRLDRMGDMIWTSAFFREMRGNFPNAKITVVCTNSNLQLLYNCPYVDRCIGYEYAREEESGKLTGDEVLDVARKFAKDKLNDTKYDVVFLPRGIMPWDMMSNIYLAVFSSASVRIAGYYDTSDNVKDWYRKTMSSVFSVIAEHKNPLHDIEKALNLLKAIGCNIKNDDTEIWYKNNQTIAGMKLDELASLRNKFDYLIAVGIASQDPVKTWDSNNYKLLFTEIAEEFSVCFLLLGSVEAKDAASKVSNDTYCIDFTGKTNLNDVMQLISISDMYVGSDTGLKHMAAALKKPVVEISAAFPWGNDNDGYSPKHCGAWKTKYVALCPETAQSEICAKAGYCVSKSSHCINNVTVNSVRNVLSGFIKYYPFTNKNVDMRE